MKNTTSNSTKKESEPKIPTDLREALADAPSVEAIWKNLTPIAQRDFVRWVESAKQAETRKRRIEKACSMLKAGKRRPCCYAVVPMNLYKALGENPKAKETWKGLTPDERRDFVSSIDATPEGEARGIRIMKICEMLAAGIKVPKQ